MDIPSFLWKEVPRRGGGWMGGSGMKKIGEMHLKSTIYESTLSTATRSLFPNGEGYETRMRLFPHIVISSESEKSFSFAVRQRM